MKNKSNKKLFPQQQQPHHHQHQSLQQHNSKSEHFQHIPPKKKRKLPSKVQSSRYQHQHQTRRPLATTAEQRSTSELLKFAIVWPFFKHTSSFFVVCCIFLYTCLCNMPAQVTADWLMDCGECHCKWNSGKKTADCKNLTLIAVPENLSNEVQVLDLSLNRIVYLEENAFLNADLTNLHKLYIRNSTLQHIDPRSFTQLEILIELDLSNNMLNLLQANVFARLVKVRAIVLNGNQLEALGDGIFQNLKYLHKVELKDNRLVKIATQVFLNVPLLSQIYLNNNRLSFLRKESFESVKRLTALSLDGNPWNCTCELQVFRDFVLRRNLYTPPTACFYPSHLRGMLWIEDQPEAFACKPRIIFPAKGASINTSKENVTLVCRVHASANTHISWDYGSKAMHKTAAGQLAPQPPVASQQRVHIHIIQDDATKEKEFGRNIYISRLTILGAEKTDEGTYTCVAENAGGKDSVQMTLAIQKAGGRDMLQGNLAAVISLMALGLLSVSIFLAMVTCCIYKRFIASASAHQHRHHHLDLSGADPLNVHGTVVANHGTTTMTGSTDVMLGVDDDTLKYKKHHHHHHHLQQTSINGGTTLIKEKYSELIKHNGGTGMGMGGDSIGSGNSPLMEQDGNSSNGGGGGSGSDGCRGGGFGDIGFVDSKTNCDAQLGQLEKKYYEQSKDDMLHIKYSHGRAQAEVKTAEVTTTGQQNKSRNSNNINGTAVEFQPDLLPAYAGHKINSKHQPQGDQLYSPGATPGFTTTTKTNNTLEDQQLFTASNSVLPLNATGRNKYNASAQEYLQAKFGTITKKQTKSQEKLNSTKREAPVMPAMAVGSSSLTVTRSSPNTDALQQMASRQTKSLFMPQRTVCSATTTVTPTDTTSSYEYRQPPPPPYNATHRATGNLLLTRRTSLNQHDNNEDNNKNSSTKDQGYRELVGGGCAMGIPLYETARQTIVTASPSMNFPTTITGYNTNTASPRRQLL